jgi:hypothetical protein
MHKPSPERLLVLLLICTQFAAAQGTTGSFTGSVTDPSGAVVPRVRVVAANIESGRTWTTETNEAGIYNLTALPPATYRVTAEAQGFKRIATNDIKLEVNQVARLDITLEVGAVAETVVVQGLAPVLQTENTQLGSVITGNTTTNLPLNGRNFAQLTLLAPGVVTYNLSGFTEGSRGGGQPLVNGNRAQANNYRLDGVDANESQDNGIAYAPNVDAIQEFKLITTNPPAEYGNAMGAIVNTSMKSGTNEFHGVVFDFLRNDKLDSNSWFGNATRQPRPHFSQNTFGGTFGGPIRRNRLFFFTDYQGWRRGKGTTASVRTVIPAAWREGDFSSLSKQLYNPFSQVAVVGANGQTTYVREPFPNNRIPQNLINPVARNLFSNPDIYPLPLFAQNANNWNGVGHTGVNDNQGDVKLDYYVTGKDQLNGRLSIGQRESLVADAMRVNPTQPVSTPTRSAMINWTRTISPAVINEARIGFNRLHETSVVQDTGGIGNFAESIGIPGGNNAGPGLPSISFGDATAIGNRGSISVASSNIFQYGDSLSMSRGRHFFKTGFELLRYQQNRYYGSNNGVFGFFDFNGAYTQQIGVSNTGSGVADFLLGYPSSVGRSVSAPWGHRSTRWGAFFQDDFKLRPNLTLNLGLRYEYVTPYVEVNDRQANFDMRTGAELFAGRDGNSRALYEPYKNGWQPRFGLAWTPSQFQGRAVIRVAYGILNYLESTGTNRRLPMNPPFVYDFLAVNDNRFLGPPITAGFPAPAPNSQPSGSLRVFPEVLKPAFIQQWNVTIEYQLTNNLTASVGYVGQDATHLMLSNRYYSQAVIGSGPVQQRRRSYGVLPLATEIVVTDPVLKQNYQGMQASVRKRLSGGLEMTAAYTWSHAMSDNAGFYGTSVGNSANMQDYGNRRAEWGPAAMDVRHNFISSFNYDLPFGRGKHFLTAAPGIVNAFLGGWVTSGVLTLRTGLPLTINESVDISNTGSIAPRPNAVANGNLPGDERTPDRWFQTSAYQLQAPNTFGNAGTGTVRNPGIRNFDFGLQKRFYVAEKKYIEFRAETFNLTNTPLFTSVGRTLGTSTFGKITAAEAEREVQFVLKFYF